jgi:hypothetical protein
MGALAPLPSSPKVTCFWGQRPNLTE